MGICLPKTYCKYKVIFKVWYWFFFFFSSLLRKEHFKKHNAYSLPQSYRIKALGVCSMYVYIGEPIPESWRKQLIGDFSSNLQLDCFLVLDNKGKEEQLFFIMSHHFVIFCHTVCNDSFWNLDVGDGKWYLMVFSLTSHLLVIVLAL